MAPTARLSVDIGGTFTDLVLLKAGGAIFSAKISSTPSAPEDAVIAGTASVLSAADVAPSELSEPARTRPPGTVARIMT